MFDILGKLKSIVNNFSLFNCDTFSFKNVCKSCNFIIFCFFSLSSIMVSKFGKS